MKSFEWFVEPVISFLRITLILVVVLAFAVCAGTVLPRPLFSVSDSSGKPKDRRILVLSNPIHTDIALQIDAETRSQFGGLAMPGMDDGRAQWIVLGWGGRSFYLETPTWADLKPGPVLRALTVDDSVMHVDIAGAIDEAHPSIIAFDLDGDQYSALLAFISDSFLAGTDHPVEIPGAGYGAHDQFYEARGKFNAIAGCNTWTAAALRSAGLRTGLWNPLPIFLRLSLRLLN